MKVTQEIPGVVSIEYSVESKPFFEWERTLENWHSLDPQSNEKWLEGRDKYFTEEERVVAVSPATLHVSGYIATSMTPSVYLIIGARGSWALPVTHNGSIWEFEAVTTLNEPSISSSAPFRVRIVILLPDGTQYYRTFELLLLPPRITPALNPQAAKEWFHREILGYISNQGSSAMERAAEEWAPWAWDEDEFWQWFQGHAGPIVARELEKTDLFSDKRRSFRSYIDMLNHAYEIARNMVIPAISSAWVDFKTAQGTNIPGIGTLATSPSGASAFAKPTSTLVDVSQVPEAVRRAINEIAGSWETIMIYKFTDPEFPEGEYYMVLRTSSLRSSYYAKIILPNGDVISSTELTKLYEKGKEARELRNLPPEEVSRRRWEDFKSRVDAVYALLSTLSSYQRDIGSKVPLAGGGPAPYGPLEPVPPDWIGHEDGAPVVSCRRLRDMMMDTAYYFFSFRFVEDFGEGFVKALKRAPDYEQIHRKCREMFDMYNAICSSRLDQCTTLIEQIRSQERWTDECGTLATWYQALRACSEAQWMRKPDWMFDIPVVGWTAAKAIAYADIPWNYYREYNKTTARVFQKYWSRCLNIAGDWYDANDLDDQIQTILEKLRSHQSLSEETIAYWRDLAHKIIDASGAMERFPVLYNHAVQLLQMQEEFEPDTNPAMREVWDQQVRSAISDFRYSPNAEVVQYLMECIGPEAGQVDQNQLAYVVRQLRELKTQELIDKWEDLVESEGISAETSKHMMEEISKANQEFKNWAKEHVKTSYVLDGQKLGEMLSAAVGDLIRSISDPASDIGRAIAQIFEQDHQRFVFELGNKLALHLPRIIMKADRVFEHREDAEKEIEKLAQDLFESAMEDLKPYFQEKLIDWPSHIHRFYNYFIGWAREHQLQRVIIRVIIMLWIF